MWEGRDFALAWKEDVLDLWLLRFGRLGRLFTQVLWNMDFMKAESIISSSLTILSLLFQRNKAGILVGPLHPKRRVRPCYRVYHRLALGRVVHHIVDSELCMW